MDINLLSIYNQIDIKCAIINEIDSQLSEMKNDDPHRAELLDRRREKYSEYLELKDELQRYLGGE